MTDDSAVDIMDEQESWLLVAAGGCFAVVERRAGRIYALRSAHRTGQPDTPAGIRVAAETDGWRSEAEARADFTAVVTRGRDLARRML